MEGHRARTIGVPVADHLGAEGARPYAHEFPPAIVRFADAAELALCQLLPTTAATSNQWFPLARLPLVHEVTDTPLATFVYPEDDDVVEW